MWRLSAGYHGGSSASKVIRHPESQLMSWRVWPIGCGNISQQWPSMAKTWLNGIGWLGVFSLQPFGINGCV
jgi:hypothetical protein